MNYCLVRIAITKKLRGSKELELHIGNVSELHKSVLENSKKLKMNITVSANVSQPLSYAQIFKIIFKSLRNPTYKTLKDQERNGQSVAYKNYYILQYC